jgi:hypothetical protein
MCFSVVQGLCSLELFPNAEDENTQHGEKEGVASAIPLASFKSERMNAAGASWRFILFYYIIGDTKEESPHIAAVLFSLHVVQ